MSDRTSNEEIFISTSFLMKSVKHRVETLDDGKFTSGVNMVLELLENILENAPAYDVLHVVHAQSTIVVPTTELMDRKECLACGYKILSFSKFKFCPNCGAKMDEEESDR